MNIPILFQSWWSYGIANFSLKSSKFGFLKQYTIGTNCKSLFNYLKSRSNKFLETVFMSAKIQALVFLMKKWVYVIEHNNKKETVRYETVMNDAIDLELEKEDPYADIV